MELGVYFKMMASRELLQGTVCLKKVHFTLHYFLNTKQAAEQGVAGES